MVYTDIYIGPANNVENKKDKLQTLSELKMHTADEQCNHGLYFLQDELDRAFLRQEFMHISEDSHVPFERASKCKY